MKDVLAPVLLLAIVVMVVAGVIFAARIGDDVGAAITRSSRQDIAERQQAQRQQQARYEVEIRHERQMAPVVLATQAIFSLVLVGTVSIVLIVSAIAGSWWIAGQAHASVKRAHYTAHAIALDAKTRQYPLLPYEICGRIHIYNPNTGQVADMAQLTGPAPQMITGSAAVQLGGVLASEAAKASRGNGEAVAAIRPPLVVDGGRE